LLIAGDDAGAKASVPTFIETLDLRPLDVGGLKMARWLEGAGVMMMGMAVGGSIKGSNFSLGVTNHGCAGGSSPLSQVRTSVRMRTPWDRTSAMNLAESASGSQAIPRRRVRPSRTRRRDPSGLRRRSAAASVPVLFGPGRVWVYAELRSWGRSRRLRLISAPCAEGGSGRPACCRPAR
jgi:hypothetical protein